MDVSGNGRAPYRVEIPVGAPMSPSDEFRRVMTIFPSAVAVLTTYDERGYPRGLTCSAFCSLSMDPPMMLACVNRGSGALAAIRASTGFAVNLLGANSGRVSDIFASAAADKFTGLAWRPGPESGLPWLYADSLAYVSCRLTADLTAASHAIIIGLVTDAAICDAPSAAAGWRTPPAGPLVYWRRSYGAWSPPPEPGRRQRRTALGAASWLLAEARRLAGRVALHPSLPACRGPEICPPGQKPPSVRS